MGVYYDAYIGYGLLVSKEDLERDGMYWMEVVENLDLPDGYSYVMGGDRMSGGGECVLIGPSSLIHNVLDSSGNGFGAIRVESESNGTTVFDAYRILKQFALDNEFDPDIGFFGISSVG